ncbi:hypothetical protein [Amycolatopsis anabasis]|uniref:hypothetical protein n=1 Tax=Amycolatopsis anabasis TaxID=1840409 RepID=UPI00131E8335|nr:hypothetical protein [Amycolatopsis anabasis]
MRDTAWPGRPIDGGFGFPLGFVATIAATLGAVAAGATRHPALALGVLVAVVAGIAAVTTVGAALGTAAMAWGLHAGFVLGRGGELAFTPDSARAAFLLAGTALVAFALTAALRRLLLAHPESPNAALGAFKVPNVAFGALSAPKATLGDRR